MKTISIVSILFILSFQINAQELEIPYPSLSPLGTITQIVGNTLIEIEYERPSVRNRKIFGGLVPWNEVWRTGAGNCTKVKFDKDVIIGGIPISSGNYSLFTIPNPTEWIVILNKDTTLYGSYDYTIKEDVARFKIPTTKANRFYETLNIDIELNKNNAVIFISWENIQISFPIKTTTDAIISKLINEELLTGKNNETDIYAGAAAYLISEERDFDNALILTEKAIELDFQNEWARSLKVNIHEQLKQYNKALKSLAGTMLMLKNKNEDRTNEIQQLELEYKRISELKN